MASLSASSDLPPSWITSDLSLQHAINVPKPQQILLREDNSWASKIREDPEDAPNVPVSVLNSLRTLHTHKFRAKIRGIPRHSQPSPTPQPSVEKPKDLVNSSPLNTPLGTPISSSWSVSPSSHHRPPNARRNSLGGLSPTALSARSHNPPLPPQDKNPLQNKSPVAPIHSLGAPPRKAQLPRDEVEDDPDEDIRSQYSHEAVMSPTQPSSSLEPERRRNIPGFGESIHLSPSEPGSQLTVELRTVLPRTDPTPPSGQVHLSPKRPRLKQLDWDSRLQDLSQEDDGSRLRPTPRQHKRPPLVSGLENSRAALSTPVIPATNQGSHSRISKGPGGTKATTTRHREAQHNTLNDQTFVTQLPPSSRHLAEDSSPTSPDVQLEYSLPITTKPLDAQPDTRTKHNSRNSHKSPPPRQSSTTGHGYRGADIRNSPRAAASGIDHGCQPPSSLEWNSSSPDEPFLSFSVAYPYHRGSLHDFVKACANIDELRLSRKLPSFLYDDFIRLFSTEYLDYVSSCPESSQDVLTAIEYYNDNCERPVFQNGVITKNNLRNVLRKYPQEVDAIRTILEGPHTSNRLGSSSPRPHMVAAVPEVLMTQDSPLSPQPAAQVFTQPPRRPGDETIIPETTYRNSFTSVGVDTDMNKITMPPPPPPPPAASTTAFPNPRVLQRAQTCDSDPESVRTSVEGVDTNSNRRQPSLIRTLQERNVLVTPSSRARAGSILSGMSVPQPNPTPPRLSTSSGRVTKRMNDTKAKKAERFRQWMLKYPKPESIAPDSSMDEY